MNRYLLKRVLTGLLMVVISVAINFTLIRLAPGDPVAMIAGLDDPNPEQIETLTKEYGLDKSIPEQFVIYLSGVVRGDFGYSYVNERDVLDVIGEKIAPTLMLSLTGMILAVVLGTMIGVYAARNNGKAFDTIMCNVSYLFDSTPSFWLGLMLILLFASTLGWLPTAGMVDLRSDHTGFAYVLDVAKHLILPVGTLVIVQFPYYFRIARSSVLQVMSEDFIMTFRATGMKEKRIFNKYVLRNALIPTITVLGSSLAFLISGTVYIETVFSWPGMGRLLYSSIAKRDYPVLSGIYLIIAVAVATMMIVVDFVYSLIDPRIKFSD